MNKASDTKKKCTLVMGSAVHQPCLTSSIQNQDTFCILLVAQDCKERFRGDLGLLSAQPGFQILKKKQLHKHPRTSTWIIESLYNLAQSCLLLAHTELNNYPRSFVLGGSFTHHSALGFQAATAAVPCKPKPAGPRTRQEA